MNGLVEWAEEHPKVVMLLMTAILLNTAYDWHRVMSWGEGQMQITASESLGG